MLAISNATTWGLRAAVQSSLGNVAGLFCLAGAALLGIGALVNTSPVLFTAMKLAGAAYLIYLGFRKLLTNTYATEANAIAARIISPFRIFAQGALLAVTNPKALLFCAALFPQFINPTRALMPQFLGLIITLMACSFSALMGYAILANAAQGWLTIGHRGKQFNRLSGSIFILLGLGMLRLESVAG